MAGRPTKFNQELAIEILAEISSSRHGLIQLCKLNENWPTSTTIRRWIAENEEFRDQYKIAKLDQADNIFDEIIVIADSPRIGKRLIIKPNGDQEVVEGDNVNRSRLMVDARKFVSARLNPRKYGDKVDVTSGEKPLEAPPSVVVFKNPNSNQE